MENENENEKWTYDNGIELQPSGSRRCDFLLLICRQLVCVAQSVRCCYFLMNEMCV